VFKDQHRCEVGSYLPLDIFVVQERGVHENALATAPKNALATTLLSAGDAPHDSFQGWW
jgi:hypothetical protein